MMHGRRDARLELASLVCMAYGLCICGVVPGSLAVSPFTQETPTQLPVPTRTETPTPLPAPTRTHKPMVATTPAAHRVATRPTPMHLPTAAPHAPIEMRQDATKITLSAAVNPVAECPLGRGKCSVFEFQGDVTLLAPGAQRIIAYAASVETPFGQIWHRTISQCHGDAQSIVVDIGANHGLYGIWAARHGCQVFMFEPQPACHRHIQLAISLNEPYSYAPQLSQQPILPDVMDSIHVHEASECEGTFGAYGSLRTASDDPTSTRVFGADALSLFGARPIRALKIDVEGAELGVLLHLTPAFRSRQIRLAVVELTTKFWHERNITRHQAWEVIRPIVVAGYRVSVVQCIWPHANLSGTEFAALSDVYHMIVTREWVQCDLAFEAAAAVHALQNDTCPRPDEQEHPRDGRGISNEDVPWDEEL